MVREFEFRYIIRPIKRQIRFFGLLRYDVTLLFYYFSAVVEIAWISTRKQDLIFQLYSLFMNISFKLEFFLHERCINDGNMICLKLPTLWPLSMIVYMCSSLLHLAVESRDLSQAQKKITFVRSWANSPNNN